MAEASDLKNGNILKSNLVEQLVKYLETDTLLYWDSVGTDLRLKQEKKWAAALQRFSSIMKLPNLQVTDSLFVLEQDEEIKSKFISFMNELDDFQLAGTKFFSASAKLFTISSIFTSCQINEIRHSSMGTCREYLQCR